MTDKQGSIGEHEEDKQGQVSNNDNLVVVETSASIGEESKMEGIEVEMS